MEQLTIAADVVRKLALLAGCHKEKMNQNSTIVFVCEHGAAKSILAAAYFNKMAREKNLGLTAIARGTHPDSELSAKTVAGLRANGLTATESIPTKLDEKDLASAQRVVSFCTLPEEFLQGAQVEYWEDVPPISEDYERARDAIVERLKGLLKHL
jgi:arsenate reductase (thioredoxin)